MTVGYGRRRADVPVRVDRVLDLSWLRDEVADLYCVDDGRPGIDPEVAVRLMLAGLLIISGIVHDRKLMRDRRFIGYGVHERLPPDQTIENNPIVHWYKNIAAASIGRSSPCSSKLAR
jgi:hypothetical protein